MQGVNVKQADIQGRDRGDPGEQKIIWWGGGSKPHPWTDIGKILVYWLILQKKFLVNQACILEQVFVRWSLKVHIKQLPPLWREFYKDFEQK